MDAEGVPVSARYDVAVVGAGIVGLGAAYAAVRRGKSVVVLDRTSHAVGATVRNFGHLCIGAQTGLARVYADASRALWLELARDAGFWLRESGTLVVARHDDELSLLEAAASGGSDQVGRDGSGIEMLSGRRLARRAPVDPAVTVGGAWIETDLQTHPREAAAAITEHLARLGVSFRWRTAVTSVDAGVVGTTRGEVAADEIVVAVNHDLDQLMPHLAERAGIVRCTLDMIRAEVALRAPLDAPLLTGWSLVRYGRFAALAEAAIVRSRLHAQAPELAALDLNQMYTQLPDGSLIIGDTHHREVSPPPFQSEAASAALLRETATLFRTVPRVIERWQGVYASGRDDFLVERPAPGVTVLAATTGIGMTTGLGLAETELATTWGAEAPIHTPQGVLS